METTTIIYLITTFVITSLLWYVYMQKLVNKYNILKNDFEKVNTNISKEVEYKSDEVIRNFEKQISELHLKVSEEQQKSYKAGYATAQSEYSVSISPYKEEFRHGDNGWIVNNIYHRIEVGYQYQLFIRDLPVLAPAVIVNEVLEESKREIDQQKVKAVMDFIESNIKTLIENSNGLLKFQKN
ncbi:hypothetical protein ACLI1A_03180 [Flavobacterium sp. RHBU_3]|uniref:hypothetical protein n=1 Tax=Flavobacterium sp. RHBU_3 TaxID=3391184 RepID=UPI00398465FE